MKSPPHTARVKTLKQMFPQAIFIHIVRDPRSGTLLMAAKTGHLGPTIFRSTDKGKTWKEAGKPPAFPAVKGDGGRAVSHTFWLSPGHASDPGVWWAGTSPPGLFVSTDDGLSWESVAGFHDHAMYWKWCPADGGTPDGALLNQIVIDPRNPSHIYIATSTGGVSRELRQRSASSAGAGSWTPWAACRITTRRFAWKSCDPSRSSRAGTRRGT